jgi:hypothetical protein
MTENVPIHCRVRFQSVGRRKVLRPQSEGQGGFRGRIPRVAQLLALAIRLEQLIASGHVANYSALAQLVGTTRARITQVANLTLLAPDIQEAVLFLEPVTKGRDPITERDLRPLVAEVDWSCQRTLWAALM